MCGRAEAAPPVSLLIAPGQVNARIPPRASPHASFLSSPHPQSRATLSSFIATHTTQGSAVFPGTVLSLKGILGWHGKAYTLLSLCHSSSLFKRSQQLSLHRRLGGVCEDTTASALIPRTTLSSPSPTGQVMALQQPLPSVPSCSLSMWFLHLFSFACPLPQCLSHRRHVSRHSFDDCMSPFPHGVPELSGWNGLFPGPQSLPFRPARRDRPDSRCPGLLFVFLCRGLTHCQPILLGRATLGYL